MSVRVLDRMIKIGFAGIIAGAVISEGGAAPSASPLVSLAGLVLVAAAGFWRSRTIRLEQESRLTPPVVSVGASAVESPAGRGTRDRLRDVGLIAFLLGLLALFVAFAALFTGPPQPRLVTAGGILTAIGAGALALRYRFFALLLACFLGPIAFVALLVAWPPVILVLLAVLLAWLLARLRRRQLRPNS
jgi:hypothetical protein